MPTQSLSMGERDMELHAYVQERVMDQELRDDNSSSDLETVIAAEEDVAARMGQGEACSSSLTEVEGNEENHRVCRICHLSSMESGITTAVLIELDCECKGELGVAHFLCAEAWFRVKGDRLCEICGCVARNVSGACDNRFLEEWNEERWIDRGNSDSTADGRSRRKCLTLCSLLMACLVTTFILPWFFNEYLWRN